MYARQGHCDLGGLLWLVHTGIEVELDKKSPSTFVAARNGAWTGLRSYAAMCESVRVHEQVATIVVM